MENLLEKKVTRKRGRREKILILLNVEEGRKGKAFI